MLLNANTGTVRNPALSTSKVLLVPYSTWHVPRYHEWMQNAEIQEATASEPLTLEEEYAMQRSWRLDADKLTFILCRPISSACHGKDCPVGSPGGCSVQFREDSDSPANMIGDVNLFLRVDDGEDGSNLPRIVGEIELMIAEKADQRCGFGRAALLVFLRYIIEHQREILDEFVCGGGGGGGGGGVDGETLNKLRTAATATDAKHSVFLFSYLSVKIGQSNTGSLALFESLSFQKLSPEPNYFGEFELRRMGLDLEAIHEALGLANIEWYTEISYERKE